MRSKKNASQDPSPGVKHSMPWRVLSVSTLPDYCLEVSFIDGTQGIVDLSQLIFSEQAGVFEVLKDKELFNQAYVEHGAVTWPGEIDLAPDAMYQQIKLHQKWIVT